MEKNTQQEQRTALVGQREERTAPIMLRKAQQIGGEEGEREERKTVEGYAALFESRSKLLYGYFYEEIDPKAFDGVLERSDVFALLNHDMSRGVLARSSKGEGSLSLSIDEQGLRYEFTPPMTALGAELLEGLERGDIRESSFAFTVEADEWTKLEGGKYLRRIKQVGQLFDVSPVYTPAYEGTAVGARMYEEHRAALEAPVGEASPPESYYEGLRAKYAR